MSVATMSVATISISQTKWQWKNIHVPDWWNPNKIGDLTNSIANELYIWMKFLKQIPNSWWPSYGIPSYGVCDKGKNLRCDYVKDEKQFFQVLGSTGVKTCNSINKSNVMGPPWMWKYKSQTLETFTVSTWKQDLPDRNTSNASCLIRYGVIDCWSTKDSYQTNMIGIGKLFLFPMTPDQ